MNNLTIKLTFGLLTACFLSIQPLFSQVDCVEAIVICDNIAGVFPSSGTGNNDFLIGNNDGGCLAVENCSAWYYFKMNDMTPPNTILEFTIDPQGELDYDFALWGPNKDCSLLGSPIRCSFSPASSTGLAQGESETSEDGSAAPTTTNGFVKEILVNPGEDYYLLIDKYDNVASNFTLSWGADAAPYLDCIPSCALQVEASTNEASYSCEGEVHVISLEGTVTQMNSPNISYHWAVNPPDEDISIVNPNQLHTAAILGNNTLPDTYTFILTAIDEVCSATDEIEINIYSTTNPGMPELSSTTMCESDESLDLTTLQDPNFPHGTWTGDGVNEEGTLFNPNGQAPWAELTFTAVEDCVAPATTTISISLGLTAFLNDFDPVYENSPPIDLNNAQGNISGNWTGDHVIDNFFYPTNETGIFTLTFTPEGNCVNSTDVDIEVLPVVTNCVDSDREALLDLYNATDGANWTNAWDLNEPMDTWYGVTVNENGCVISIDLDGVVDGFATDGVGNNLVGQLPALDLPELAFLNLSNNMISGFLPSFGNLPSLEYLALSHNDLNGSIPSELLNSNTLKILRLNYNNLSGELPNNFTNLSQLEEISLFNNQISGIIPFTLNTLNVLEILNLGNNNLIGNVPSELGEVMSLISINLSHNQLTGIIPSELSNLVNLETLILSDNQLSGQIPMNIGSLVSLRNLWLSNNQISGDLPMELGQLFSLETLLLCDNQISGSLPIQLGNLSNLETLFLCNNQISGSLPTELANLTNLNNLWLNNNNIEGCFPIEYDVFCMNENFNYSFINNPNLSGGGDFDAFCLEGINDCACANDRAALIALYNATGGENWANNENWLVPGSDIGTWYGVTTNESGCVIELDLYNNILFGSLPAEIGQLSNLIKLQLSSNQLSGNMPIEIGNLTNLSELYLDNNELIGSIPTQIGLLSDLDVLFLYNNELTGNIPVQIGNLLDLNQLFLFNNQLTGNIPTEIGNLLDLNVLTLGNNQLTGNIPIQIGNLLHLTDLQLSYNQLSGSLPTELVQLSALGTLNLSNNLLSGCFPDEFYNAFCNINYYNFTNNPDLPNGGDFEAFCNNEISPCNAGLLTLSITTNLNCNSTNNGTAQVNATGGTPPYTYAWSNGATSNNLTNLFPIEYSVTITDAANTQIEAMLIPDANFEQALISNGIDMNQIPNGYISKQDAEAVMGTLDVSYRNIDNLLGIGAFTNISILECSNNNLSCLDVSNNVNLNELRCSSNILTSLDISNNDLRVLDCYGNELPNLDVSANANLEILDCSNNELPQLDVTHNTNLLELDCTHNLLTDLIVDANVLLETLYCTHNDIGSLNTTNLSNLMYLWCDNNNLTGLDLSNNTSLLRLNCYNNELIALNVKNGNNTSMTNTDFRATNNPNLTCIMVDDPEYSTNTWFNIDAGASFDTDCFGLCNLYTSIPDSHFEQLLMAMGLDNIEDGQILSTQAVGFTGILDISNTQIADLRGIEAFSNLRGFTCNSNTQLTALNLSNNYNLRGVTCKNMAISYLNIQNGQNELLLDENVVISQVPNLRCMQVDDESVERNYIDPSISLLRDCPNGCFSNIVIQDDVCTEGTRYEVANTIHSTSTIRTSAEVTYRATDEILLGAGFTVDVGGTFHAYISEPDCGADLTDNNEDVDDRNSNDLGASTTELANLHCYPNPFKTSTTIEYHLATTDKVDIQLYNLKGSLVQQVLPPQEQKQGTHKLQLDASKLIGGVYYLRMRTGSQMITRKLVILH